MKIKSCIAQYDTEFSTLIKLMHQICQKDLGPLDPKKFEKNFERIKTQVEKCESIIVALEKEKENFEMKKKLQTKLDEIANTG